MRNLSDPAKLPVAEEVAAFTTGCLKPRILLIQLRQLGDIVLTTPCVRELRRLVPEAHISFLGHTMARAILAEHPDLDELYTYHESDSLAAQVRLIAALRRADFDLVFDFMNNPRSALLAWLSGAPRRIGFSGARRAAYTHVVPRPSGGMHVTREKFLLLAHAGYEPRDITPLVPVAPDDLAYVAPYLAALPSGLRVALSPTHRRTARRWPMAHYIELATRLMREWGAVVTWLHGPGEEELVEALHAACPEPTHMAPRTSLRQLTALLAGHDLFIGNSNGPSHFAIAAGCPSLQLHGPTEACAWSPCTGLHEACQSPSGSMAALSLNAVWERLGAMRSRLDAHKAATERLPSSDAHA